MAGFTNRGKFLILKGYFQQLTNPTNFYVALLTSATAPTIDTNLLSQLTEIATGNGYTAGGYSLTPDATDFDVLTENDSLDQALIQVKDVVWTASGGTIPASGNGARYAVLTTDDSDPQIIAFFDLSSDRTVSDTQTLTLDDLEIDATEP